MKNYTEKDVAEIKTEQQKITNERVAERDKILSNLSHSIKNLLATTVTDKLEVLKQEGNSDNAKINEALRGAALIRGMVNAIHYSYAGTTEDIIYDVNNCGSDSQSLKSIIYDSFIASLANIFDGNNFGKFQAGYFVETDENEDEIYDLLLDGKMKLNSLNNNDLEQLVTYCKEYFFDLELDIEDVKDYIIGDSKGSKMKLFILIQEVVFNAVKYSSFIDRSNRGFIFKFIRKENHLELILSNYFNPNNRVKSTGLGKVIIENMSKLFQGTIEIKADNSRYDLKIAIPNFWEKESANYAEDLIESNVVQASSLFMEKCRII